MNQQAELRGGMFGEKLNSLRTTLNLAQFTGEIVGTTNSKTASYVDLSLKNSKIVELEIILEQNSGGLKRAILELSNNRIIVEQDGEKLVISVLQNANLNPANINKESGEYINNFLDLVVRAAQQAAGVNMRQQPNPWQYVVFGQKPKLEKQGTEPRSVVNNHDVDLNANPDAQLALSHLQDLGKILGYKNLRYIDGDLLVAQKVGDKMDGNLKKLQARLVKDSPYVDKNIGEFAARIEPNQLNNVLGFANHVVNKMLNNPKKLFNLDSFSVERGEGDKFKFSLTPKTGFLDSGVSRDGIIAVIGGAESSVEIDAAPAKKTEPVIITATINDFKNIMQQIIPQKIAEIKSQGGIL